MWSPFNIGAGSYITGSNFDCNQSDKSNSAGQFIGNIMGLTASLIGQINVIPANSVVQTGLGDGRYYRSLAIEPIIFELIGEMHLFPNEHELGRLCHLVDSKDVRKLIEKHFINKLKESKPAGMVLERDLEDVRISRCPIGDIYPSIQQNSDSGCLIIVPATLRESVTEVFRSTSNSNSKRKMVIQACINTIFFRQGTYISPYLVNYCVI
jgi:hypothetical protein